VELTIVIPTNRNHTDYVNKVVENINSFPLRHEYQIVVVSKERAVGRNVVWLPEVERIGPINAFNLAVQAFSSRYYIFMVDDHVFRTNPSDAVEFIRDNYQDRKFPIASLSVGFPCYNPVRGQVLGSSPIDFDVAKHPLCRFPVFDRRVLEPLGGKVFHPKLFYHAADILLGYYMGMNGEPSLNTPTWVKPHRPTKDSSHEVNDCEIVKSIIKEYTLGKKQYL
jgi:hypothetical protein